MLRREIAGYFTVLEQMDIHPVGFQIYAQKPRYRAQMTDVGHVLSLCAVF